MVRIAVIGAGRMGRSHGSGLSKIKDCEISGVFDPSEEAANNFCECFGVEKKYSSEKEIAEDKSVDGVVIANFTDQHAASLTLQLEAGKKKIFCEKPAVRKLEDGKKVLALAKKKRAKVVIGHHKRLQAGFIKMHEIIESGRLGKIRMAKVDWCSAGYSRDWDDFFANFERSGGTALDMMTHMFDQMNWNFGEPESVCGSSIMLDRSMPQPMDYVTGTLIYKNGVMCNIDCSWQRYGVGSDYFEVYGDKACAVLRGGEDKLHIYQPGEHVEVSFSGGMSAMEGFVKVVKGECEPSVTLEDGIKAARVSLGMIEAAKTNTVLMFNKFK